MTQSTLFNQLKEYLSSDPRFEMQCGYASGGIGFRMNDLVDLSAPCSGPNLDTAKYNVILMGDIPNYGVEIHIEMYALSINEWETVFWGAVNSVELLQTLLHYCFGLPKANESK